MPIYVFQCPTCGAFGEAMRKMADSDQPLYCDGAELFETEGEFGENKTHEPVRMQPRISKPIAIIMRGPRYA